MLTIGHLIKNRQNEFDGNQLKVQKHFFILFCNHNPVNMALPRTFNPCTTNKFNIIKVEPANVYCFAFNIYGTETT